MADPRHVFRLHLGVAALAVGAIALAALVAASRLCLKSADGLAAACDDVLASADVAGALILLMCGLAVVVIARIVWSAASTTFGARRAIRALPVCGEVGGALVLDVERLEAFCAGFWRPRAYVSRGTVAALAPEELAAVIAHEHHHAARRDPLRSLAARSLATGLFFVPSLRDSADRLRSATEIAADEAAISTTGDVRHLAAALLAFDGRGGAVSAARVDHLLGESEDPGLPLARVAGGVAAMTLLVGVTIAFAALIAPDSIVVSLVAGHAVFLASGGALVAAAGRAMGRRVRRGATAAA